MRLLVPAVLGLVLLLPATVLAGGVHPSWRRRLEPRFRADTSCTEMPEMHGEGAGLIVVTGCGQVAKYVCKAYVCILQERSKTAAQIAADAQREKQEQERLARRRPRVEQETHADGYPILRAILPAERLEMRVTAAPTRDASQVLWTIRFKEKREAAEPECQHALVANGAALLLTEVKHVPNGELDEFRFKLPIAAFTQLAAAERVVGRTCEVRWQMNEASLNALRELVVRFQETIALEGGATASTVAPPAEKTSL